MKHWGCQWRVLSAVAGKWLAAVTGICVSEGFRVLLGFAA